MLKLRVGTNSTRPPHKRETKLDCGVSLICASHLPRMLLPDRNLLALGFLDCQLQQLHQQENDNRCQQVDRP
jgi:hypothetical protein